MLLAPRRPVLAFLCLLLVLAACGGNDRPAGNAALTAPGAGAGGGADGSVGPAGSHAYIDVAVANLWAEPGQARPLDDPSLSDPVDMRAWLSAMTVDDRLWLVGRLVTQALYGDRVLVLEERGGWTKVAVERQPSSLDPRGYPGWLPTVQLSSAMRPAAAGFDAVVVGRSAPLHDADDPDRVRLELSFNTRLPVVEAGDAWYTVAVPGGGMGLLPVSPDVDRSDRPPPSGEDLVRAAEMFSGVDYLWAGTSSDAWDCSGLTEAVYAAHGVVIPRDAHDQAAAGAPVARDDLLPGDLLFYSHGSDVSSIDHVAMYVGGGQMVQAPATGRTVETVPVDRTGLDERYWGARRYLPDA